MKMMDEKNLLYYQQELSYLQRMGGVFAAKYPKIAKRLNINENLSSDPHVERLLESFAFLTGYLHRDIEDQFPRVSSALLGVLYPIFVNPIPPLSIAHFKPDPKTHPMTTAFHIDKGFSLFAAAEGGQICRFQTCYPINVWPMEVSEIELTPTAHYDFADRVTKLTYFLRIRIKTLKMPIEELGITHLRFYINTIQSQANSIYQLMFEENTGVCVVPDGSKDPHVLPPHSLSPVGFDRKESVIPIPDNAHLAYGLLQEYFAFPQKFMFFEVNNLDFKGAQEYADILIPLSNAKAAENILITPNMFLLSCTPIINLFSKTTEPIRFDHRKIEYPLIADQRRMLTTEIHSIEKVFAASDAEPDVVQLEPYFSYDHASIQDERTRFWHARRVPSLNPDVPSTDMMLSFVDLNFNPDTLPVETVYARVNCTNRLLATTVPSNAVLQSDEKVPTESILCLYQPTDPIYPTSHGQSQWQLISHLSLSFLSLSSDGDSLTALKEILRLYSGSQLKQYEVEINSLLDMKTTHMVKRFGEDAWRGFTKGTGVELTIDEAESYGANSMFLFTAVLSQFFGLYARINSFTELSIKSNRREGVWKKWPAVAGTETFL